MVGSLKILPDYAILHLIITENIKINDINKRISDSEDLKSNAKTSRQIEHASNLEKIDDLDVAINAIEEAIKILDSLVNSDGNASFLQIKTNFFKQKKENIKKSFAKIKKNFFANVLLEAFSTIETDQNFTNQKLLNEVIDLLNELKSEFQTQKIAVQEFETQQQDSYEKYDKNLADLIGAENDALIISRNEVKRLDGLYFN